MPVTGYSSSTVVSPGGSINFCLSSAPAGVAQFRFEQIGVGMLTTGTFSATLATRPVPATNPWDGFAWPGTGFTAPSGWSTGLYRLHGKGAGDFDYSPVLDFVVKPPSAGAGSKTLLLVDFVTPQVYNAAGGKSLYDFNSSGGLKADRVSFDRPSGLQGSDATLIGWLRANAFGFECGSMVDLHASATLLDNYSCLIFGGHCEYWSREMRERVEAFVRRGGNVISLSGNTCYRQVRFESSNRRVVCYKYAKNDPTTDLSRTTVAFAQPPVNWPQNSMLGVGWTYGAFNGPPTPYKVNFPGHWAFSGAPLNLANPVTGNFMHYETDACAYSFEPEGYPRVTGEEDTPLSTVVLASADLGDWTGKPGLATMTLYTRNGMVFSAGTTDWIEAIGDPVLNQVTKNVVNRLRNPRVFDWEQVGHVNGATALTSVDNKLYVTTTDGKLWRRYPVLAEANWKHIGHALNVIAMAGTLGTLFAVSVDNVLWCRPPVEADITWTNIGSGPPAGTRALTASGGSLYAIDGNGRLMSRPARKAVASWTAVGTMPLNSGINALTAYGGVLFASTTGNRLLRTNVEFIEESNLWLDLHHCDFSKGLAVVDGMLFVATSNSLLWWLDLRSGALDARSGRT